MVGILKKINKYLDTYGKITLKIYLKIEVILLKF